MVLTVLSIVEIKFRYAQLEKTPEGLAQIGCKPHQVQVCQVCWSHFTELVMQKEFALLLIQ